MKKILVLFAIFIIALFGLKSFGGTIEQGYISVSATSQLELVPDVVDFSVEIVSSSKDSMAKAIAENKKVSAKVYEDLKNTLSKTPGDSIKTSNYSANPVYKYVNNKRLLDYYEVRNSIKVHTKNVADVGKMIDTATSDGATTINNISYSLSKYEDEANKLLSETAKKARTQGDNIAKSIGSEITGVKYLDSSCSFSSRTVMPRMMLMSKALGANSEMAEDSSTNIEVGTMTLNARVNAQFYIK